MGILKAMMPMTYIRDVLLVQTNIAMQSADPGCVSLTMNEYLKWLGYWQFMSLHSDLPRDDFWRTYVIEGEPTFNIGQYGIGLKRFKFIHQHLSITTLPTVNDDSMSEFDTYLEAFHSNMTTNFTPGDIVVIDESMMIWTNPYTCSYWKVVGRKPNPYGQEYHDAADGLSKIIFSLELARSQPASCAGVTYKSKMAATVMRICERGRLLDSSRIIVADSAFGSFELSEALHSRNTYSILAIKAKAYWPKFTNGGLYVSRVETMNPGSVVAKIGSKRSNPNYRFMIAGEQNIAKYIDHQTISYHCSNVSIPSQLSKTSNQTVYSLPQAHCKESATRFIENLGLQETKSQ